MKAIAITLIILVVLGGIAWFMLSDSDSQDQDSSTSQIENRVIDTNEDVLAEIDEVFNSLS